MRCPTPTPPQGGEIFFRGFAAPQLILELLNLRVNTAGVNPLPYSSLARPC